LTLKREYFCYLVYKKITCPNKQTKNNIYFLIILYLIFTLCILLKGIKKGFIKLKNNIKIRTRRVDQWIRSKEKLFYIYIYLNKKKKKDREYNNNNKNSKNI